MEKKSARHFGIFFILSFLSYAIGIGLMDIVQSPDSVPEDVWTLKYQIVIGAVLISVFHTIFNMCLLLIMFNILKPYHRLLSSVYLFAGLFGTLMLALGSICLILAVPFSEQIIRIKDVDTLLYRSVLLLCSEGNHYLYQLGMTIWGLAGITLCNILHSSKLVPVNLALWGYAGYLVFIIGTISEFFGYPVGMLLSIPGGLFELTLSVWLIAMGFNEEVKPI